MRLWEYADCDGTHLADLIRQGEVTAHEVQDLSRRAISEMGQRLNAVVSGPWNSPVGGQHDRHFSGVPIALKDLGCAMTGIKSYAGSYLSGEGLVSHADSHLVRKMCSGGLVPIALATTDELGCGPNTNTPRFGQTLNPWRVDMSPGGSSGGSAALVASGAVPVAHGSDAGGSIRIPASVNGLVGLKPSRGRIPTGPERQEGAWGLSSHFVLTRSVRDTTAALKTLSSPMPGDRTIIKPLADSWGKQFGQTTRPLRVALITEAFGEEPVNETVVAATKEVASVLEDKGHFVETPSIAFDWDEMLRAVQVLGCASAAIDISAMECQTGLKAETCGVQPIILSYYEYGNNIGVIELGEALKTVNTVSRVFGEFFQQYDVLVLPNMTRVSWCESELDPNAGSADALAWMRKMFNAFCFNPVFNVTGTPALSVPTGKSESGFPVGVQLAADMCREDILLDVATLLEIALPWRLRKPAIHISNMSTG